MSPSSNNQNIGTPAFPSVRKQVARLFAHKGEWLNQELYELFYSPSYFPELQENQSCVLIGGRGTGKTTVLRGLSYEGQYKLVQKPLEEWKFIGIYYRIESNVFSTLKGLGIPDEGWQRPFAHYFNLVISGLILKMMEWYQSLPDHEPFQLQGRAWHRFQQALALPTWENSPEQLTAQTLSEQIDLAITHFEIYLNNILDPQVSKPTFSMMGVPISALIDAVQTLPPFIGKPFYILLDEYESFSDYQQRVVNTLIRQSSSQKYCFKVGVRELGWRVKHTLNEQELQAPNDYRLVSIEKSLSGAAFRNFAESVCNRRLAKLEVPLSGLAGPLTVKELLPSLANLREAELLGVKPLAKAILQEVKEHISAEEFIKLQQLPPMLVWFANAWEINKGKTSVQAISSLIKQPRMWKERFKDNYIYAYLFAIKKGRSGIRKYYTGWDTYARMAGGNIRFLLQLVEAAIKEQANTQDTLTEYISFENQTKAAELVGYNNLLELEGVDVKGRKILKLVQGLGRIFEIFAADPFGRAPEVVQFSVPELNGEESNQDIEISQKAEEILQSAYSFLGLQRAPSNKLNRESSKGFDYSVHPVFSAYFHFSFRKKRKMILHASEIIGLVENQSKASSAIIARTKKLSQLKTDKKEIISKQSGKDTNEPLGQLSIF